MTGNSSNAQPQHIDFTNLICGGGSQQPKSPSMLAYQSSFVMAQ